VYHSETNIGAIPLMYTHYISKNIPNELHIRIIEGFNNQY
jgi:hypothetical protein